MTSTSTPGLRKQANLVPITNSDVTDVAAFLNRKWREQPVEALEGMLRSSRAEDPPNHGFMLVDDGNIVGAYVVVYADRIVDGRIERFCNLAAWRVLDPYRHHGLRLMKALLAQPGYQFTDLTPVPRVAALNARLGFQHFNTELALIPNLPWPTPPGRVTMSSSHEEIEEALIGDDLRAYRDHVGANRATHLLIRKEHDVCHVIFRKYLLKRVLPMAQILHVSNGRVFRETARWVSRHLLLRYGRPVTEVELRVAGGRPSVPHLVMGPGRRVRMHKTTNLDPERLDYLYSELFWV